MLLKPLSCVLTFLAATMLMNAQVNENDFIQATKDTLATHPDTSKGEFGYKQLIIPGVLIGYGFAALNSKSLDNFDKDVREDLKHNTHTDIDQFTLYAPAAAVYALNAFGVKGKHNFKDRTIVYATAFLLSNLTVKTLKSTTDVTRPNGLVDNSFPSGHTTAAFLGAEFLWQEYKDVSVWYGVAGYTVATATGIMRLTNDRHWVSDIVAGAGIGILSTKAAYWLLDPINNLLFSSKEEKKTAMLLPFYNGNQAGGNFVMRF
ncbi:phosphatase PAP2 family protein [Flavobacterium suzhouense]|uniref:Phosphatase PAP2 family protein n=1 Tax=Flavobacterium suzhouense TaxID=1529638 RepID=A0ABW5NZI6_9FLAO